MRPLLLALLAVAACTPAATPLAAGHPARPDAPTGRLAGPPASLRPGAAAPATPAPAPDDEPAPAHDHSSHGGAR